MTRSHRRWHLWLYTAIGPLAAMGLVLGLWSRPTVEPVQPSARAEVPLQTNSVEAKP